MRYQKRALTILAYETQKVELDVEASFRIAKQKIFGNQNVKDVLIGAYGSPGRREMVGGDSDADVLMICREWNDKTTAMRNLFIDLMKETYHYSKIDLPNWGSLDECELYLQRSIVESNQIVETRFLVGDMSLWSEFCDVRNKHMTISNTVKKIMFSYFYLKNDIVYKNGDSKKDLKYSKGGSRQYLTIGWFYDLMTILDHQVPSNFQKPKIINGLRSLLDTASFTLEDYDNALSAFNFYVLLRREILTVNLKTNNKAKGYLDDNTIEKLIDRGFSDRDTIIQSYNSAQDAIAFTVNAVVNESLKLIGSSNQEIYKNILANNLTVQELIKSVQSDDLMLMAALQSMNLHNDKEKSIEVAELALQSTDPGVLGLLASLPCTSPSILDTIVSNQLKEQGYDYVVRITSKNMNTSKSTLRKIIKMNHLDYRYVDIAYKRLGISK